jgi:hypothetical protein
VRKLVAAATFLLISVVCHAQNIEGLWQVKGPTSGRMVTWAWSFDEGGFGNLLEAVTKITSYDTDGNPYQKEQDLGTFDLDAAYSRAHHTVTCMNTRYSVAWIDDDHFKTTGQGTFSNAVWTRLDAMSDE